MKISRRGESTSIRLTSAGYCVPQQTQIGRMKMIPVKTKISELSRQVSSDNCTISIVQDVIEGPNSLADKTVTLVLTQEQASDLALRILWDLVPASEVVRHAEQIVKLAKKMRYDPSM